MGSSVVGFMQPSTVQPVIPRVRLLQNALSTGSSFHKHQSPPHPPPAPTPKWVEVPQRVYEHGRRQRDFKRSEPILFSVNDLPGINMGDALRKHFTGLDGRDDPMFKTTTGAISCRFLVWLSP